MRKPSPRTVWAAERWAGAASLAASPPFPSYPASLTHQRFASQFAGTIGPATAAALVLAGVLSVVLFPGTALTVLADHRREVPR